jgi:hypothetical protein
MIRNPRLSDEAIERLTIAGFYADGDNLYLDFKPARRPAMGIAPGCDASRRTSAHPADSEP